MAQKDTGRETNMNNGGYERFAKVLRNNIVELPTDLSVDLRLSEYGLDSLGTIGLLVELEDEFGFEFPDSMLTVATFETVSSLWDAVLGASIDSNIDTLDEAADEA